MIEFSDQELERYARHIVLKEVGAGGQARLKTARVVVIGAGGIGSPVIQYIAAAGVGTIVGIDDDAVALSNLQRQTLFGSDDIGRDKVAAAGDAVRRLNPEVRFEPQAVRIDAANAAALLDGADVVVDGCDNYATRLAVADAAAASRITLVSAAVGQFDGQLAVFRPWEPGRPCYRCLVGSDPDRPELSCAEAGVLGALTGIVGSLAALEAIRAIVGFGDDPTGKLLLIDTLAFRFRTIALPKDPGVRMRGLTVIVATEDLARFQAALTLASAHAALGGAARLYFNEGAARLLRDVAALETARDLGVRVIACQTGLAGAGLALPEGVEGGGMVSLLAELGDDRLITV